MKKKNNVEISYFENLHTDWVLDNDFLKRVNPTGQAKVLFVKHKLTSQKGVFRKLQSKDSKSIKRFHRELRILTELKPRHPNLINIFDHTRSDDEHWYISERGQSVQEFKIKIREDFQNKPDDLIQFCAELIYNLSDGLAIVHEKGIIHRDIKPDNIVVVGGQLVLIDFGLAYSPYEERISGPEEATGNRIFSHDHQRRFIKEPKPWLDVFMLSQLLIWFMEESGSKNWFRPLDWRFVEFIEGISQANYLSLRAITALCSEISISPKNAFEFKELLTSRMLSNQVSPDFQPIKVKVENIQAGISRGQNIKSISQTTDRQILTSCFPIAHTVFKNIFEALEELYKIIFNSDVLTDRNEYHLDSEHNDRFEMAYDLYLNGIESANSMELLEWHFGEAINKKFHFRVMGLIYSPSFVQRIDGPHPPENSNIFTFYFQMYSNDIRDRDRFPFHTNVLTIQNNGEYLWWDEHFKRSEPVKISQVTSMVKEWIENPIAWELIQ